LAKDSPAITPRKFKILLPDGRETLRKIHPFPLSGLDYCDLLGHEYGKWLSETEYKFNSKIYAKWHSRKSG